MSNTAAYPKILHVGDKAIAELFDGEVEITEKLDGSQFGFGKVNGELVCRSKGKEIDLDNPDKMFQLGVDYVKSIEDRIPDGMFFYGEYLQKPRHSTLAYARIPKNYIAIFGVYYAETRTFGDYNDIIEWSEKLDVDPIPLIWQGKSSPEHAMAFVTDRESYLGGQLIEGIVVKTPKDWMFLGKLYYPVMAGKYVTERFKETHEKDWKKNNTGKGQFERLKEKYHTEARWHKAVMHLIERSEIEGTPRDIGKLIAEIKADLTTEEKANIQDELWNLFGEEILRHAVMGFPNWYKDQIALGKVDV